MGQLKDQLRTDMTIAMKARDQATLQVLRMALAAIGNAEVAGDVARELTDVEELTIVQKEVSSRKDSAEAYTAGKRPELAEKELAEVEILNRYLPAALSDTELTAIIDEAFAEVVGDQTPTMKHMGQIIKAVNGKAKGRAEGGTIAALVKARLA
ncbi:MAG: GatB/YqeY domain-containing protein [Propionibacteriaceae bacterium]